MLWTPNLGCGASLFGDHGSGIDKDLRPASGREDARLTLDGEVRYYREDLIERYLTLIGTPTAAETLELSVARLLEPLVWGDPLSVLEIPE